MINKLKTWLNLAVTTHYGRIGASALIIIILAILTNITGLSLFYYLSIPFILVLFGYTIAMMYYAVKNAISDFKNR